MSSKSILQCIFFFNPLLGDEATEGRKILYFYPNDMNLNIQKDYVGLTEGLINFTRDFSPDRPCEALHCEKHTQAFYECEKDFWLVLVVKNPKKVQSNPSDDEDSHDGSNASNDKEDTNGECEYLEDELDDAVMQAIIRRCYHMFRLFNGTMTTVGEQFGMDAVRHRLHHYMRYFIPSVRFTQLPFFTDILGFQFLPVDRSTFLTIQYLVNLVQSQFPQVEAAAVMYDSKLIWSGINQDDMFWLYYLEQDAMRQFYSYLSSNQLTFLEVGQKSTDSVGDGEIKKYDPQAHNDVVGPSITSPTPTSGRSSSPSDSRNRTTSSMKKHHKKHSSLSRSSSVRKQMDGYLTGPRRKAVRDDKVRSKCSPRIFIRDVNGATPKNTKSTIKRAESKAQRLVVYKKHGVTIFYIVRDEVKSTSDSKITTTPAHSPNSFYDEIQKYTSTNLKKVGQMLHEQTMRVRDQEDPFRFLYFNHMNLALKTTLNAKSSPDLNIETIKLIRNIHHDFNMSKVRLQEAQALREKLEEYRNMEKEGGMEKNSEEEKKTKKLIKRATRKLKKLTIEGNGTSEVCVKTRNNGWVVGRRATQSHREFFVLIDEKGVGNLSDIQEEVDRLSRTYFYNIFIY